MQAPQERQLGRRTLQKGHRVKWEEDRCYYIPLLDSLKQLGTIEVVKEHVSMTAYANTHTYALYYAVVHIIQCLKFL